MGSHVNESASFQPSCVKICRRVWPVGEFPKRGINKNILVIFHPCAQKPPRADMHLIWHSYKGRWLNHLWQIFWWSVERCRFCRGSKIVISHWQSQSPLTQLSEAASSSAFWRLPARRGSLYQSKIVPAAAIVLRRLLLLINVRSVVRVRID